MQAEWGTSQRPEEGRGQWEVEGRVAGSRRSLGNAPSAGASPAARSASSAMDPGSDSVAGLPLPPILTLCQFVATSAR